MTRRIGAAGASLLAAALGIALLRAAPAWGTCHTASFDPPDYRVGERDGSATVTVRNPGPGPIERTVDYETVSEQAAGGADFVAASGTLSFTATQTVRTIDVVIVDDPKDEPDEQFEIRLIAREGSCISQPGAPATITIADDDAERPASVVAGRPKSKKPAAEPSATVPAQNPSPTSARKQGAPAPRTRPEPANAYAAQPRSSRPVETDGPFGGVDGWSIAAAIVLGSATGGWVWRRFSRTPADAAWPGAARTKK